MSGSNGRRYMLDPLGDDLKLKRRWAMELRSVILSMPSGVLPAERNFIINPHHPDFKLIEFLPAGPFQFDPRLK